tara:strand:- start:113 stop:370 length:258 start_codon:yes stop_codon:yes gene_type:complete
MLITQSVVLPKSKYTLNEAIKKVEELKLKSSYNGKIANQYKSGQTNKFWRFRQRSPTHFKKESYRTKKINDIYLVLGELKDNQKK